MIRHTQIQINNFTFNLIGPNNNLTIVFNLVMPPKIAYLALEIIVAAFPSLSPLFCMSLDILIRLPSELDSKHKPQSATHLKKLRFQSILEFILPIYLHYSNFFYKKMQHANNSMYSIHHVACNVNNYSELTRNEPPWET